MRIEFVKIDHVQLTIPADSESEARKFYSGVLGLEEIEKPASLKASGGVWFIIAGAELHLGVENPKGEGDFSKAHTAFEVKSLNKIRVHLVQNGVDIKEEIAIPGRKRFTFRDPFGNRIELLEID